MAITGAVGWLVFNYFNNDKPNESCKPHCGICHSYSNGIYRFLASINIGSDGVL